MELKELLEMTGCRDAADLQDMANVGKSLLDAIAMVTGEGCRYAGWTPADDPAEIVIDLLNDLTDTEAALAVCRQAIVEQAAARADPDMPILTPEVLESLRGDAEAGYACADTAEERIQSHGLSLLCDWQDRAREAKSTA
jgi:hypothetical protein